MNRRTILLLISLTVLLLDSSGFAQNRSNEPIPPMPKLLSQREQADVREQWLKKRLGSLLLPMIKRHGIIAAVERAVDRPSETVGYTALLEMGLDELAFEAVIVRHPDHFSATAVARARERISAGG